MSEMNLYLWYPDHRYWEFTGLLAVVASSLEEARRLAAEKLQSEGFGDIIEDLDTMEPDVLDAPAAFLWVVS